MRVVTMNVRHWMSQRKAVADIRHAASLGGIVLWQEIDTGRYKQAVRDLGPEWEHSFAGGGLVISWKAAHYELVKRGAVMTHPGRARVTPNRYVQWVVLRRRSTKIEFAVLNTQAISGGWSKGWRPTTRWRREMWAKHMAALEQAVTRLHVRGYPVIGGGDMNRSGHRFLGELVKYDIDWNKGTHGRRRYDYLYHLDTARYLLRCWMHGVERGFFSDHDAAVAQYSLTVRPPSESGHLT